MSKGKRVRDEVPEKILKRHNEIRRRYEEMLARERAENPERLKYLSKTYFVDMTPEVTKRVYFIGNERMLIAHDSNRLRFS